LKQDIIDNFDPNGVCLANGNFAGLPFEEDTADVILFPIPWEVTVSYNAGTAGGPENIREGSLQLDLYDADIKDAWQLGIYMRPTDDDWWERSNDLREQAEEYIGLLEKGEEITAPFLQNIATKINEATDNMVRWVHGETKHLLKKGKLVGLVGGDHSTPLGYLKALTEIHTDGFGILQIDAHCDLRDAYEGFIHSHASIFYNALKMSQVQRLVQVGIRDYCSDELAIIEKSEGRIQTFFDQNIKERQYNGITWNEICEEIVATLPQKVYISFDIDGLDPKHCPDTGTPVPGGFEMQEMFYLLKKVVLSGRTIIGFDLSEVGGEFEWDGNVGARIIYKLCNLMGRSNGRI
jgi:agmatinase